MGYQGYSPRLLGDVDILGDDDEDFLGEDIDILGAIKRAKAKKMVRGGGSASNAIQNSPAMATRRLALPIDSVAVVGAGLTVNLVLNPVEPFRGEALAVDPSIAASFVINAILIGRKNQLIGAGALACTLCSPVNPFPVQWDTAQTSQPITFNVTNTSAAALRFMGQVLGTVVTH
jgi:hypothetical protein